MTERERLITKDLEMKYIIKLMFFNLPYPQYIGNGKYNFGQERYIVLTERTEEARTYSSFNRAKAAIERMLDNLQFVNLSTDYTICGIDPMGGYHEYPQDYRKAVSE